MTCHPRQLDSGHWHCPECGYTSKRPLTAPFRKQCSPSDPAQPRPPRVLGVGDHLERLLRELGISPHKGCQCAKLKAKMNALGVEGCRRERVRLASELAAKSWQFSAFDSLRAAGNAIALGLPISPLDRFGSLIDIAIERAEK
jgi:hypothetical protein